MIIRIRMTKGYRAKTLDVIKGLDPSNTTFTSLPEFWTAVVQHSDDEISGKLVEGFKAAGLRIVDVIRVY